MRAIPQSVCKEVMDNFVLRLKKDSELNGGHVEQILYSTKKNRLIVTCFGIIEYKK